MSPGSTTGAGALRLDRGRIRRRLANWAEARIDKRVGRVVDQRVRDEVGRRLAETEGRRLAAADHPAILDLVSREVAQQAEADGPDKGQRDRDFTAGLLLGAGHSYDRTLSVQGVEELLAEIRTLSGVPNVDLPVQRAYQTLLESECRGLGRIAGTTDNIMGKLVLPPLLRPAPGPVLEIGTLFGLFSSALMRQFQRAGDFRSLTVVDPFVGSQVQDGSPGRLDRSGTPVTEEVARRNFSSCGLRPDEVRLVRGYSTDPHVRSKVADQAYGVVVIDGDHSASGVYQDLWWAEEVVAPAGIVVMDDWGDPGWPGVEVAGRRYLADGGRLELLGRASTSAYLRRP